MSDCFVHRSHQDSPESFDIHHVIPQSWGGPTKAPNLVTLCPSGHRDTHVVIDVLVLGGGELPPWFKWRHFNKATRDLAARGYTEAIAAGLTPKRTL